MRGRLLFAGVAFFPTMNTNLLSFSRIVRKARISRSVRNVEEPRNDSACVLFGGCGEVVFVVKTMRMSGCRRNPGGRKSQTLFRFEMRFFEVRIPGHVEVGILGRCVGEIAEMQISGCENVRDCSESRFPRTLNDVSCVV